MAHCLPPSPHSLSTTITAISVAAHLHDSRLDQRRTHTRAIASACRCDRTHLARTHSDMWR
eukprot:6373680-Alexandrium_andersonii.AAC.1